MPSKSLQKVQKHVSQKQNGKKSAIHENSRDARRIRQASRRDDKVAAVMGQAGKVRKAMIDRVRFFQGLAEGASVATLDIEQAVQSYLQRDDEEIQTLQATRRPGRPASSRETALQRLAADERTESSAGLWVPDLRHESNVHKLCDWDGSWPSLAQLQFVRVRDDGVVLPSTFPPNRSQ